MGAATRVVPIHRCGCRSSSADLCYTIRNYPAERRARESTAQAVAEGASRGKPCLARISQAPGLRPDGTLESRRALLVWHRRSNPIVKNKEQRAKNKICIAHFVLCSLFSVLDRGSSQVRGQRSGMLA